MCKCGERKCNEVCNTKRQSRLHQTDLAQLQNAQHVTITAIYAASMKLSQARVETCMDKLVWDNICRSKEGCTNRVACLKGQNQLRRAPKERWRREWCQNCSVQLTPLCCSFNISVCICLVHLLWLCSFLKLNDDIAPCLDLQRSDV